MIKFFKLFLLAVILTVGAAAPPQAQASAPYVYSNGYWWGADGYPYVRYRCYTWSGCHKHYKWCWRRIHYGKSKADYTISSQTEGWRTKLLEMKAAQNKWQADIQASANNHNEFVETLREMGMAGQYYQTSIGVAQIDRSNPYAINGGGGYGGYGGGYGQRAAPQGNTLYGYNEVSDTYGNVDLGALYNAAIRLAGDSNAYGSTATSGAMSLVDKFGDRAASLIDRRIALHEIQAKTQGIVAVANSLGAAIKAESRTYTQKKGAGGDPGVGDPALQQKIAGGSLDNLQDIITHRCARCHSPGGKAASFDLTNLDKLPNNAVELILDAITSSDPKVKMPPPPEDPLSVHEIRVVFGAANQGPETPDK